MITYLNHATLNKSHLVPMAPSSTCPFPKPLQPQLLIPIKLSFWPWALLVCLPSPSLGPFSSPPTYFLSQPSSDGPSRRSGCTFPHFYNKPFSSTIPPWGIMSSFSFLWVSGSLFCNFDCPNLCRPTRLGSQRLPQRYHLHLKGPETEQRKPPCCRIPTTVYQQPGEKQSPGGAEHRTCDRPQETMKR